MVLKRSKEGSEPFSGGACSVSRSVLKRLKESSEVAEDVYEASGEVSEASQSMS